MLNNPYRNGIAAALEDMDPLVKIKKKKRKVADTRLSARN